MEKYGKTPSMFTMRQRTGLKREGALSAGKNSSEKGEGTLTDYRTYRLRKRDWLRESAVGLLLAGLVSYSFYRSVLIFLLMLPAACIAFPLSRRETLRKKRQWELQLQFKEAIWLLSGYLSAGLSVENAFGETVPELVRLYGEKGMITSEFRTIVRGIRLNKAPEPLLLDFGERSGVPDIRNFAEVFGIARKSGGNMQEIIERATSVIRDKTAVTEEIRSMTASRRYEQNIMNVLPFVLIAYIRLTSRGYLDVMYETFAGRAVMTVCLGLLGAAYLLSARILEIRI